MFRSIATLCVTVLALGTSLACRSQPAASGPVRLAVLPAENQTGDPQYDWMTRAFQLAIVDQLRLAEGTRAVAVDEASQAAAVRANRVLYARLTRTSKGTLLEETVEDVATHQLSAAVQRSPLTEDSFFTLSRQIAQGFSPKPVPLGTAKVQAYRAYASRDFASAVAADPGFGDAWVERVRQLANGGQRDQALAAIEQARHAVSSVQVLALARLRVAESELQGDPSMRRQAIYQLAAATPEEAESQGLAAQSALAARDYPKAIEFWQKATKLAPEQLDYWNSLSYAEAYRGDLPAATKTLAEYRRISKDTPNALDSQAEIEFLFGRFAEAEKLFLEVAKKDPSFLGGTLLRKAAEARWHSGDAPGAAKLANDFLETRKKAGDGFLPLHQAQWEYRSGHAADAMARLARWVAEAARGKRGAAAGIAAVQLGLWNLESGDFPRASEACRQAQQLGVPPQANSIIAMCLLSSGPDAPAEKISQGVRLALAASNLTALRRQTEAFALTMHGHFEPAIPLWREVLNTTDPGGDSFPRTMLAWTLAMAGRAKEAEPLVRLWSPPQSEEVNVLDSLLLDKAVWTRAKVAEVNGKPEEARRWAELYLRGKGKATDRWRMAETARKSTTL